MLSDKVTFITKALIVVGPYLGRAAIRRVAAYGHSWTWRNTPDAKNIVVLGGSFAGTELVRGLTETLPTGNKVVWIEKHSHFNYIFNFPRYSVLKGREQRAFIPYDFIATGAPLGILTRIQDEAIAITDAQVLLTSGERIDYACLAIVTGSTQPLPANVSCNKRSEACRELQGAQQTIEASPKIALVGGGAVGVQLASDFKDFFPTKDVILIHSRDRLMNRFGSRLQDYVLTALRDELKIRILLNERPKLPVGGNFAQSTSLPFSDGHKEEFDLVIGCIGQRPNSSLLKICYPDANSKENSRILVRPTLQVFSATNPTKNLPIFAFGDVADHSGPRMGRAGWTQAGVVLENILSTIQGQAASRQYVPDIFIEGAIKLTLGKTHLVFYAVENGEHGSDFLIPSKDGKLDLEAGNAWKEYGVGFKQLWK